MSTLRGFLLLLLLGIVGSTFLLYQLDMLPKNREGRIRHMQETRKQRLREMCDSDKNTSTGRKHRLEDISSRDLKRLIVDDNHGVIFCTIPKVGSTNWKRVMAQSTQLANFPITEMKAKLKQYTKFVFVRDPFVRLISAYRSKFQKLNSKYYQVFARHILRRYGNQPNPPKTVDEAFASGVHVSFYNFIQYLVDPQTKRPFDPHWRPMHQLCHPCLIQYDFIGHLETLEEDAEHLLKLLKLEHIKFPLHYENMTTAGSALDWFGTVPLRDQIKLYKIYQRDFILFGYNNYYKWKST